MFWYAKELRSSEEDRFRGALYKAPGKPRVPKPRALRRSAVRVIMEGGIYVAERKRQRVRPT